MKGQQKLSWFDLFEILGEDAAVLVHLIKKKRQKFIVEAVKQIKKVFHTLKISLD